MLRTVLIIIVVAIVVAAVGVAYAVFRTPEEASAPIQAVPLVVETAPAVVVATDAPQAPAVEPTATSEPTTTPEPEAGDEVQDHGHNDLIDVVFPLEETGNRGIGCSTHHGGDQQDRNDQDGRIVGRGGCFSSQSQDNCEYG